MARDTTKGLVKWPIDRLGVVLDTNSEPSNALRFLLALYRCGGGGWAVYPAGRPGSQFRFTGCLFLLSALAHEYLHGGQGQAVPAQLALLRGDEDEYGHVARYYRDVKMQDKKDGTVLKYKHLPLKLRYGIRSILEPGGPLARREDAVVYLRENTLPEAVSFWWLKDFELEAIERCAEQGIELSTEQIPTQQISPREVRRLKVAICGTPEWARWKKGAGERRRKANKPQMLERLRAHLHAQALFHLKDRLHPEGPDNWVPLRLTRGRDPKKGDIRSNVAPRHLSIGWRVAPGRIWDTFDMKDVWTVRESHFLTSVPGGGKTTFLRYVQLQSLRKGRFLAVFIRAPDLLLGRQALTWESIRLLLLRQFSGLASRTALRNTLDKLHCQGNILFLVDQMDGLQALVPGIIDAAESKLTGRHSPVLMAGGPTTAHEVGYGHLIMPLALEPFDTPALEAFFGRELHSRAIEMCKGKESILETPMHARLVKSLLTSGGTATVRSLWDLYSMFVNNIPGIQPQNRDPKILEEPIQRTIEARRALGRIAYEAMTESDRVPQDISVDFAERRLPDDVSIDSIWRTGLAGVAGTSRKRNGRALVFSHQSFLEFFAAEWASEDEARVNHIVHEYWNPKWKAVMTFLAAVAEADMVKRIYPSDEVDNPIHSRLLLAAELSGETDLESDLEDRLVGALDLLLTVPPFRIPAMRAQVQMRTDRSHDHVWAEMYRAHSLPYIATPESKVTFLPETVPVESLRPLYRDEYLRTILSYVRGRHTLPFGLDSCFLAWSDRLPETEIPRVFDQLVHKDEVLCAMALAPRIDGKRVEVLVDELVCDGPRAHLASRVLRSLAPLPPGSVSRLINKLISRPPHPVSRRVISVLDSQVETLDEVEIVTILEVLLSDVSVLGGTFPIAKLRMFEKFPQDAVGRFIEKLSDPEPAAAGTAMVALRQFADRMSDEQIDSVFSFVGAGTLCQQAIETAATVIDQGDRPRALKLLRLLGDENTVVRTGAMMAIRHLSPHVTNDHLDQIGRNLQQVIHRFSGYEALARAFGIERGDVEIAEVRGGVIAFAASADRLKADSVWLMLETLAWLIEHGAGIGWDVKSHLTEFQDHLNLRQIKTVVAEVCNVQDPAMIVALMPMLPPRRVTRTQTNILGRLLENRSPLVRRDAARLLNRIHECRGIV